MTLDRSDTVNRAGHLALIFSSLKALGISDRAFFNDVLRGVLLANPCVLGVWSVWEPNALDGRDTEFAGALGHDTSGRFVPLWHRHGGKIQLEPNTNYDQPEAEWYFAASRRRREVVIDPYEYPVGGKWLFITSQAAPIMSNGNCVGVAGFDIHMDSLLEAEQKPAVFEPIEAVLGRGHVLLDEHGAMRYCSHSTRRLITRYVGKCPDSSRVLPEPLHDLVIKKLERGFFSSSRSQNSEWTFENGDHKLVMRFTRHPHAGCFLLLVDEQFSGGKTCAPAAELTPREQEVADWMCQGKSNEEIAIILGISVHTVKNHLDKVFRKLGVENRHAAAVALQFRSGRRQETQART